MPLKKPAKVEEVEEEKKAAPTAEEAEAAEEAEIVEESTEAVEDDSGLEEVVEEETEEPETGTEVAVKQSTEVAQSGGSGTKQVLNALAEKGFDGLELDFSSFTGIVLNDGEFECTNGETIGPEGFKGRITGTKAKFAYRSNHKDNKDVDVVYSYDPNAHTEEGSNVFERIKEWEEEGAGLGETKKYLEVGFVIEDEDMGELNGTLVQMSIPPTSIGRLSGYIATQAMKGEEPGDFITHVKRGEKVTKVDFPYYPWAFVRAAE